jgi:hypothetical protein
MKYEIGSAAQRAIDMLVETNTLPRPRAKAVVEQLCHNEREYTSFCLADWEWECMERRNELMYRAEGSADILNHLLPLPLVDKVRREAGMQVVNERCEHLPPEREATS